MLEDQIKAWLREKIPSIKDEAAITKYYNKGRSFPQSGSPDLDRKVRVRLSNMMMRSVNTRLGRLLIFSIF